MSTRPILEHEVAMSMNERETAIRDQECDRVINMAVDLVRHWAETHRATRYEILLASLRGCRRPPSVQDFLEKETGIQTFPVDSALPPD